MSIKGKKYLPEISVKYRRLAIERKPVRDTEEIIEFLMAFFDKDEFQVQEKIVVLLLDESDIPIGGKVLFSGTRSLVNLDWRIIYQLAIVCGAQQVVVAHNHPGGEINPSEEDIESAIKGEAIGRFLGIKYRDDIILCQNPVDGEIKYFSFADSSLLLAD